MSLQKGSFSSFIHFRVENLISISPIKREKEEEEEEEEEGKEEEFREDRIKKDASLSIFPLTLYLFFPFHSRVSFSFRKNCFCTSNGKAEK